MEHRLFRPALALIVAVTVYGASCGCAEPGAYVAEVAPSPPKTPLIGGVREDFRHWDELVADPSPTAAKTRAEVAWAALEGDDLLMARFRARGIHENALVVKGIVDAERALLAFPHDR